MDHFFEQKTLRENQELNKQVFVLNKQIKELQEKVFTYEQIIGQLDEAWLTKALGSMLDNSNVQIRKPIEFPDRSVKAPPKPLPMTNVRKKPKKQLVGSSLEEGILSRLKTLAGSVLGNENMQRKLPEPQQTVRGKMNNPALRPLRLDDTLKVDPAPKKGRGVIRVDDTLKVDPAPKKPRGKDLDLDDKPMDQKPFKPRKDDLQLDDEAINESHTKAELQRIKDGKGGSIKLRGLVDKYKGKIEKAKTAAEKKHHRDEIATIRDMLSDSYVPKTTEIKQRIEDARDNKATKAGKYGVGGNKEDTNKPQQKNTIKEEQLLNEIGETPVGQLAVKLARARAGAKLAWDKSVSTSFATHMGKPGDVEKVNKDIAASEKVIAQANKRIKPTDTVSEGLLGSAMTALGNKVQQAAATAKTAVNTAVDNMPSNKTVARGLGDVIRGTAAAMQQDRAAKRTGVKPEIRNANALDAFTGMAHQAARRLEADQRQKRAFPRNP